MAAVRECHAHDPASGLIPAETQVRAVPLAIGCPGTDRARFLHALHPQIALQRVPIRSYFCAQVMLAIMVTWQTLLQTGYDNHYHKNSFAAWRELLFPDQFRAEYRGGTYTSYLYSADDMNVFLTSIMHRYDTLEERSIDIVSTYAELVSSFRLLLRRKR